MRSGVCIVATCWLFASAHAQETTPTASRPENGYWSAGEPRFFVSQRSELGTPYAKPYLSVGYGLPHWIWTGIDVNAIFTLEMAQVYAGVRAATPVLDLALGVRDTWSVDKPFLYRAEHLHRADVLGAPGAKARYWALEAEAVGIVPLPHSALVFDFITVHALDAPRGSYVYDEAYRAVVKNPLFFVLRAAPLLRILNENSFKIGVVTETVFGTGRDKPVVRVGPAASLQLTDHLEINVVGTFAVSSPDALGLFLSTYGVAGIRYKWATGEQRPRWPWQEPIIP